MKTTKKTTKKDPPLPPGISYRVGRISPSAIKKMAIFEAARVTMLP